MQNDLLMENFEIFCDNEDYINIEKSIIQYPFLLKYDNGYFFCMISKKNNVALINLFLQYGADISCDDYFVLYKIAENRNFALVEQILNDYNININVIKNTRGYYEYLDYCDNNHNSIKTLEKIKINSLLTA